MQQAYQPTQYHCQVSVLRRTLPARSRRHATGVAPSARMHHPHARPSGPCAPNTQPREWFKVLGPSVHVGHALTSCGVTGPRFCSCGCPRVPRHLSPSCPTPSFVCMAPLALRTRPTGRVAATVTRRSRHPSLSGGLVGCCCVPLPTRPGPPSHDCLHVLHTAGHVGQALAAVLRKRGGWR